MEDYSATIDSFKGKKILLVGDVMLDRYVYGHVDRISPEAPVPVLKIESEKCTLGGAGTVLRNLSDLGAETFFISVIGDDNAGHEVTELIGQIPNVEPSIITESGRITTVKTRHISGNYQIARADYETGYGITAKTQTQIINQIKRQICDCDVLILSDYGKGVIAREISLMMISLAVQNDKAIVVDPKSKNFDIYSGSTVITPNLNELSVAYGKTIPNNDSDVVYAAKSLMNPVENMLVTRGKEGMTLIMGSGEIKHMKATGQEVFDVTGAGDTVVAVLSLGMASGLNLSDSAYLSNIAAGIVVGKLGTATVGPEELKEHANGNVASCNKNSQV